jgi:hypothetical protein
MPGGCWSTHSGGVEQSVYSFQSAYFHVANAQRKLEDKENRPGDSSKPSV